MTVVGAGRSTAPVERPPVAAPLPSAGAVMPELDGLRALAATNVLVSHALVGSTWTPGWLRAASDGALGVELFFVLSGFLLFLPFARAWHLGAPRPSLRGYAARRALRILPAYYVALGLLVLFRHAASLATVDGWRTLLALATMTQGFSASTLRAYNPVFWSLAVEEQFYLLLPLAAWAACRPGGRAVLVASLPASHLVVALLRWAFPEQELLISASLPFRWDAFALGMLLADARVRRGGARVGGVAGVARVLAAALGPAVAFGAALAWQHGVRPDAQLVFAAEAAGFALLLWGTLTGPAWIGAPWRLAPVRALGLMTYSVYLWHWVVADEVAKATDPPSGPGSALLRVAIVLALTLPVAATSWRLVEGPFLRLRSRLPR